MITTLCHSTTRGFHPPPGGRRCDIARTRVRRPRHLSRFAVKRGGAAGPRRLVIEARASFPFQGLGAVGGGDSCPSSNHRNATFRRVHLGRDPVCPVYSLSILTLLWIPLATSNRVLLIACPPIECDHAFSLARGRHGFPV